MMQKDENRHSRGGLYFEGFAVGGTGRAPLHAHGYSDGQHAVLKHDS